MCNQSALYQKKVDGWKGWEWGGGGIKERRGVRRG